MAQQEYKPFSITATALGHPRKLHTPITVVNITESKDIIAAKVNAMWDTGAEFCLMSQDLAKALHINYKKSIPGNSIFGRSEVFVGIAYVALLSNGDLIDTYAAVVESTSPDGEYSFIIGMDFIRKGTLAISSTKVDTTLSFTIPSPEPIDFAKLYNMMDGSVKYCPLSSVKEDIRPVFGPDVLELIAPRSDNK